MPSEVVAMLGNVSHDNSEVEDLSMALLRFTDNCYAQVTASVVHHGEKQEIVLQGEHARISIPWEVAAMEGAPNGFPNVRTEFAQAITNRYQELGDLAYEGHAGQIGNLLDAIESGTAPLVTAIDGRNALELITAIYASGSEGRIVRLPIGKDDPFYTVEGIRNRAVHFHEKQKSVDLDNSQPISLGSTYNK
jgi:UDP-N-acetyl-2-amino-2-deoxyglucuronate dehydrogenase